MVILHLQMIHFNTDFNKNVMAYQSPKYLVLPNYFACISMTPWNQCCRVVITHHFHTTEENTQLKEEKHPHTLFTLFCGRYINFLFLTLCSPPSGQCLVQKKTASVWYVPTGQPDCQVLISKALPK